LTRNVESSTYSDTKPTKPLKPFKCLGTGTKQVHGFWSPSQPPLLDHALSPGRLTQNAVISIAGVRAGRDEVSMRAIQAALGSGGKAR